MCLNTEASYASYLIFKSDLPKALTSRGFLNEYDDSFKLVAGFSCLP